MFSRAPNGSVGTGKYIQYIHWINIIDYLDEKLAETGPIDEDEKSKAERSDKGNEDVLNEDQAGEQEDEERRTARFEF